MNSNKYHWIEYVSLSMNDDVCSPFDLTRSPDAGRTATELLQLKYTV